MYLESKEARLLANWQQLQHDLVTHIHVAYVSPKSQLNFALMQTEMLLISTWSAAVTRPVSTCCGKSTGLQKLQIQGSVDLFRAKFMYTHHALVRVPLSQLTRGTEICSLRLVDLKLQLVDVLLYAV